MKITIDIPEEFRDHFYKDSFEDSFRRVLSDIHLCAGLYEKETIQMLISAFKNAEIEEKELLGEWPFDCESGYWKCSSCTINNMTYTRYRPNCGIRMDAKRVFLDDIERRNI